MARVVVRVFGASAGAEQIELLEPLVRARPLRPPAALGVTDQTPSIADLRNQGPTAGVVSAAGDELMAALNAQEDVKQALASTLGNPASCPIYLEFCTGAEQAERLPWEALHDRSGAAAQFLAMQDYWPIARRAEDQQALPVYRAPAQGSGSSPPLLKVLAVIAPARANLQDKKGEEEWDALHAALHHLAAKPNPGIDLEIRVMVADTHVESHIRSTAPAVTVVTIPDKRAILDEIKNYQPHVLHVFTHGSTIGGSHIKLAHTYDIQSSLRQNKEIASIKIDASEIRAQVRSTSVPMWLTVLNCCETAVGVAGGFSFAFDLISPEIPAAIGMAERIDAREGHAFTKILYPDLIDKAERDLPTGGTPYTAVEWAPLLWFARQSICESVTQGSSAYLDTDTNKEWTFPVLYVYPAEFRLQRPIAAPSQQAQAQVVAQAQSVIRGTPYMPSAVIDDLQRELESLSASV